MTNDGETQAAGPGGAQAQPAINSSGENGTDKAVPPSRMPQDKGGWRVAPAPDGRGTPDEHKPSAPVAILSEAFWKEKFDGSPTIIGQRITLDGRAVTVVGVAQPNFTGPAGARLWLPRE